MKRVIIILSAIIAQQSFAQIADDALILSRWHHEGTARVTAMGGAFNALGGDITSATTNPAGLGLYRGSDFNFSVAGHLNKSNSSYLDLKSASHHYKMNMPTFGVALSSPNYKNLETGDGPKSWTFAIGYNQIHTFNRSYSLEGTNNSDSYLDAVLSDPVNIHHGIFLEDTDNNYIGLISQDSEGFYHDYMIDGYGTFQEGYITEKGGIGEYFLSFATNFWDNLYLGATFGIQSAYLRRSFEFAETPTEDDILLEGFDYSSTLTTTGIGYNFKAGLIYAPIYWFKFGVALHTPTSYTLLDREEQTLTYVWDGISDGKRISVEYPEYDILTPFRLQSGISFLVKKQALIALDYEFVDYSMSQITSTSNEFRESEVNNNIINFYEPTHSFRLGGEYKLGAIALRAGGFYYGSPYANDLMNKNNYKLGYAAGLGFRSGSYYFDIAYSKTLEDIKYSPYGANYPTASIDSKMTKIMGTLGFRF